MVILKGRKLHRSKVMNAENNNKENPWVDKFNELVNTCQNEFKRTTQIGMKMVSASQSTAQLQEEYQKLVKMVAKAMKKGDLKWENEEVAQLLEQIAQLKGQLKGFEKEVQELKNE